MLEHDQRGFEREFVALDGTDDVFHLSLLDCIDFTIAIVWMQARRQRCVERVNDLGLQPFGDQAAHVKRAAALYLNISSCNPASSHASRWRACWSIRHATCASDQVIPETWIDFACVPRASLRRVGCLQSA